MGFKSINRNGMFRTPIGIAIQDLIISGRHLRTECPAMPDEPTLTVWSANCHEQIEAMVEDYLRSGDLQLEEEPVDEQAIAHAARGLDPGETVDERLGEE